MEALVDAHSPARLIVPTDSERLAVWLKAQSPEIQTWIQESGFTALPGSVCLLPDATGKIDRLLFGVQTGAARDPWAFAVLPSLLPAGTYHLDTSGMDAWQIEQAASAWAIAGHRFNRYKSAPATGTKPLPLLIWPEGVDRAAVTRTVQATILVRELINTPAADLGPEELALAVRKTVLPFDARVTETVGEDLLRQNYPMIYAVGQAASRAPRLIDVRWGPEDAPRVTLVGKGVCFDTGGLDLKTAGFMKIMKKDMGGAAHMLALAMMVMAAKLPVRLRLLIPAVENSVAGNAFRPMDILNSRKGVTVEIGNTDAEGRLILADALTEAASENPALLIDCATLTGAARMALGPELPALFSNDDALAADLLRHGAEQGDSVWRLPLWPGYRGLLDSKIADLNNAPDAGHSGAITAALFLKEFIGASPSWIHLDMTAWNYSSRPGRPEGGEALALRALFALLAERFAAERFAV